MYFIVRGLKSTLKAYGEKNYKHVDDVNLFRKRLHCT